MKVLGHISRRAWGMFRSLLGDDAYERYIDHVARHHGGQKPLGREEFHRVELDRRWSQVNRCC